MKVAVLGGSFNPVHIGHLALADEICVSLGYDKVLFVPVFSPPHKTMNEALPPEKRTEMVELACQDDPRFKMEPCEIQRGGVSYTYDTICFIEEKYKPEKIGLVIGRDLFSTFHLWKNAALLAKKCELILAERPFQAEDKNEPLAVSSTSIRFRAANKMAFQYLVPSKVFKYIIEGNLYGSKN